MTKYIKLLSYPNAVKVIDFVESFGAYAHIVVGGISVQDLTEESLDELIKFLKNLNVKYEISDKYPQATIF